MAVFGPRTVQYREKYSVFLTAIDYYDDIPDGITVSLIGNNHGEEIGIRKFTLGFLNKTATFDVSRYSFHRFIFQFIHSPMLNS